MTRPAGAVLAIGLLLVPAPAGAQSERYGTVSFSSKQTYESNLFAAPSSRDPQPDLVFQLGPTFEVGRVSPAFKLVARYGLAAERYVDQVTLNKALARQDAGIELQHHASRRVELDTIASFVDTHTPGELNLETGLAAARTQAKRFTSASEMTYDWCPSAKLNFHYTFTTDTLAGGALSRTHNADIGLVRHSAARGNVWNGLYALICSTPCIDTTRCMTAQATALPSSPVQPRDEWSARESAEMQSKHLLTCARVGSPEPPRMRTSSCTA